MIKLATGINGSSNLRPIESQTPQQQFPDQRPQTVPSCPPMPPIPRPSLSRPPPFPPPWPPTPPFRASRQPNSHPQFSTVPAFQLHSRRQGSNFTSAQWHAYPPYRPWQHGNSQFYPNNFFSGQRMLGSSHVPQPVSSLPPVPSTPRDTSPSGFSVPSQQSQGLYSQIVSSSYTLPRLNLDAGVSSNNLQSSTPFSDMLREGEKQLSAKKAAARRERLKERSGRPCINEGCNNTRLSYRLSCGHCHYVKVQAKQSAGQDPIASRTGDSTTSSIKKAASLADESLAPPLGKESNGGHKDENRPFLTHEEIKVRYNVIFDDQALLSTEEDKQLFSPKWDFKLPPKKFIGGRGHQQDADKPKLQKCTAGKSVPKPAPSSAAQRAPKRRKSEKTPAPTRRSGRKQHAGGGGEEEVLSTSFVSGNSKDNRGYFDHKFGKILFVDLYELSFLLQEVYTGKQQNHCPIQRYIVLDEETGQSSSTIKVLAERETKTKVITDCYWFNDALHKIQIDSRRLVMADPVLKAAAFETVKNMRLKELPKLEVDGKLQDYPPTLFAAAELHPSKAAPDVAGFEGHHDSLGQVVCFYGVYGESYTFICVRDPTFSRLGGRPEFDKLAADWKKYQTWKDGLDEKQAAFVENYENDFKAENDFRKGYNRILVFHMTQGRRIIFQAQACFHGSLIPANQARCIAILHDVEPNYDSFVPKLITPTKLQDVVENVVEALAEWKITEIQEPENP